MCEKMGWQSMEGKVWQYFGGDVDYGKILGRIKNIHSNQLRLDSMISLALFRLLHPKSPLQTLTTTYSSSIDKFSLYLEQQRPLITQLKSYEQYSNINQLQKVRDYVCGLYLLLKVVLRFCEILKLLMGINNLSIKFTIVKKQLEGAVKVRKEWKIPSLEESWSKTKPIEEMKEHLINKSYEIKYNKICEWCLMSSKGSCHKLCEYVVNFK